MNLLNKKVFGMVVLGLFSGLVVSQTALANHMSEAEIIKRIKPVGTVCLEDGSGCSEDSVAADKEVVTAAAAPVQKSGADVFNGSCMACHGSGIAGAPKVGDSAAWVPRMAQGMDVLLDHALKGFKGMPPKGACGACSDDEIKAAVEHMVTNSK